MVDRRIKVLLNEDNVDHADLMRLALADAGSGQFELLWVDRLTPAVGENPYGLPGQAVSMKP